jgi:hypothetical protein
MQDKYPIVNKQQLQEKFVLKLHDLTQNIQPASTSVLPPGYQMWSLAEILRWQQAQKYSEM